MLDLKLISKDYVLQKKVTLKPFIEIIMPNGEKLSTSNTEKNEKFKDNDVYFMNYSLENKFDF